MNKNLKNRLSAYFGTDKNLDFSKANVRKKINSTYNVKSIQNFQGSPESTDGMEYELIYRLNGCKIQYLDDLKEAISKNNAGFIRPITRALLYNGTESGRIFEVCAATSFLYYRHCNKKYLGRLDFKSDKLFYLIDVVNLGFMEKQKIHTHT